jgi:hypothetical protein
MRRIILQFFMLVILLSLVSCGEEVEEYALPHPFAAALGEFMSDYDGVVRAYLATLDGSGTMGLLIRPTTKVRVFDYGWEEYVYVYRDFGTVFYMQDGELREIFAPGFVAGRYNRLLERLYAHTHIAEIIWKLEDGRWEISTQLDYFSDAYIFYLNNGWDNGFFDERLEECDITIEMIANREARAKYARERYGLVALPPPNFGHMYNTDDQTARILAMTVNCVPDLQ